MKPLAVSELKTAIRTVTTLSSLDCGYDFYTLFCLLLKVKCICIEHLLKYSKTPTSSQSCD